MSITYKELGGNEKSLRSHTGLNSGEFEALLATFTNELLLYLSKFTLEGKMRQRKANPRCNSKFKSLSDMLLFILYYFKTNPLQEVLAKQFSMDQPQAQRWIKLLRQILLKALKTEGVLPKRSVNSLNNIIKEHDRIIIDVTERAVQRSVDEDIQKEHYSGKKSTYDKELNHS
jgi:hypothetical protein